MHIKDERLNKILNKLVLDNTGVYTSEFFNDDQILEIEKRKDLANSIKGDALSMVSRNHSICVMDNEIRIFLKKIPKNGIILDSGGCWGWHWRNIEKIRPDVKVFILDLVKENFSHAKQIVGNLIGKNIFLVHGDATKLPFEENSFDGYWTVQTFQHIPNYKLAVMEAYRVLTKNGTLDIYNVNSPLILKLIYKILGKNYVEKGIVQNSYYFSRATNLDQHVIEEIFQTPVSERFTEVLFQPELKMYFAGSANIFGKLDAYLSNSFLFKSIARQRSFHAQKL